MPHRVLNARDDKVEAAIIAQAGQRGAVTISTNMAGRGTDIRLGEGVAALGGLYVIGTNRHESRRIDNQLCGRAGRQGDPGCSRFFVSLEDPLIVKYGDLDPRYRDNPASIQRLVEGQHLDQRQFLHRYDVPVEGQRNKIHAYRQSVLDGTAQCRSELERQMTLRVIDDLWADYLARLEDFRAGIPWQSYAAVPGFFVGVDYRDPHFTFLRQIDEWFPELEAAIPVEVARRLAKAEADGSVSFGDRGAVWTFRRSGALGTECTRKEIQLALQSITVTVSYLSRISANPVHPLTWHLRPPSQRGGCREVFRGRLPRTVHGIRNPDAPANG